MAKKTRNVDPEGATSAPDRPAWKEPKQKDHYARSGNPEAVPAAQQPAQEKGKRR